MFNDNNIIKIEMMFLNDFFVATFQSVKLLVMGQKKTINIIELKKITPTKKK